MKLNKVIGASALAAAVAMMAFQPSAQIVAQDGTPQAPVIVITATPQGEAPAAEPTAGPAPVSSSADPGFEAFKVARTYLQKKIGKNLTYVTNWSYDLLLFNDVNLGCPTDGVEPRNGNNAGYSIKIQPIGDANVYELRVTYDLAQVFDCGKAGTAPGGAPIPAGGVPGSAAAAGFEVGAHVQGVPPASTSEKLKAAKLKWLKVQVKYGDGAGASIVAGIKAQGFKALVSVVGSPNDILGGDAFFTQYATFVGDLAGAGADAIEVWNEMNLDREWPNGQINPATYVQMLAKAGQAIRSKNSNTLIISGAPAPTGAAGPGGKTAAYWNDDVYLAEMAAAGAGQYVDCIGLHYNEGTTSPNASSGAAQGDNFPTRYFSPMLARGLAAFPGKKACFTELGYLSPDGYGTLPAGFTWGQGTDVNEQAQWLAEAAVRSAQSGNVRLMIIFNGDFTFFGADPQAGYALIRPGGACPACTALAAVLP